MIVASHQSTFEVAPSWENVGTVIIWSSISGSIMLCVLSIFYENILMISLAVTNLNTVHPCQLCYWRRNDDDNNNILGYPSSK